MELFVPDERQDESIPKSRYDKSMQYFVLYTYIYKLDLSTVFKSMNEAKKKRAPVTAQQIRDYVTDVYLETSKGCTAKEIAAGLNVYEQKVRELLEENLVTARALSYSKEERKSHSKDYPMLQSGWHYVSVWYPSRHYLAALLKNLCTETGVKPKPVITGRDTAGDAANH